MLVNLTNLLVPFSSSGKAGAGLPTGEGPSALDFRTLMDSSGLANVLVTGQPLTAVPAPLRQATPEVTLPLKLPVLPEGVDATGAKITVEKGASPLPLKISGLPKGFDATGAKITAGNAAPPIPNPLTDATSGNGALVVPMATSMRAPAGAPKGTDPSAPVVTAPVVAANQDAGSPETVALQPSAVPATDPTVDTRAVPTPDPRLSPRPVTPDATADQMADPPVTVVPAPVVSETRMPEKSGAASSPDPTIPAPSDHKAVKRAPVVDAETNMSVPIAVPGDVETLTRMKSEPKSEPKAVPETPEVAENETRPVAVSDAIAPAPPATPSAAQVRDGDASGLPEKADMALNAGTATPTKAGSRNDQAMPAASPAIKPAKQPVPPTPAVNHPETASQSAVPLAVVQGDSNAPSGGVHTDPSVPAAISQTPHDVTKPAAAPVIAPDGPPTSARAVMEAPDIAGNVTPDKLKGGAPARTDLPTAAPTASVARPGAPAPDPTRPPPGAPAPDPTRPPPGTVTVSWQGRQASDALPGSPSPLSLLRSAMKPTARSDMSVAQQSTVDILPEALSLLRMVTGQSDKATPDTAAMQALPASDTSIAASPVVSTAAPVVQMAQAVIQPVMQPMTQIVQPPVQADLSASIDQQVIDMTLDGQWIDRMAEEIVQIASDTGRSTFRLSPQALGAMQVDIFRTDKGADVRLMVQTDAAEAALQDGRHRLETDARLAGARINDVTIVRTPENPESVRNQNSANTGANQHHGQNNGQGGLSGGQGQGNNPGSQGFRKPAVIDTGRSTAEQPDPAAPRARYA